MDKGDTPIHPQPHPMKGATMRIKAHVTHSQRKDFGGSKVFVEDWWDRLVNKSWGECDGNAACLVYAVRIGFSDQNVPPDDEVVYVKHTDGIGNLVHVSELEEDK